ncbi:class I adenylate-forming enzyme family protein [Micromonospora sp. M12]
MADELLRRDVEPGEWCSSRWPTARHCCGASSGALAGGVPALLAPAPRPAGSWRSPSGSAPGPLSCRPGWERNQRRELSGRYGWRPSSRWSRSGTRRDTSSSSPPARPGGQRLPAQLSGAAAQRVPARPVGGLRADDTVLVNLPLYFSYALVAQALAGLVTGARLVITGPPSPRRPTWRLREHRVTSSSVTPYMVRQLIAADWRPPERLRMLTVGGEQLSPVAAGVLRERFPELELYLTYGLTEAGPRVATLAAHREPPHRLVTVGRPLEGSGWSCVTRARTGWASCSSPPTRCCVARWGGRGRVGDCLVGPDQIATGDLFRLDEEGYLHFRGRLSDFVVTGGAKVSLASVRRIANALPNVVASKTRTYQTSDGTRFDLDLYLREVGPAATEEVRRQLRRQLIRAEWPSRIRALSLHEFGHK